MYLQLALRELSVHGSPGSHLTRTMQARKDNSLNWLIVFTESIASKATKKLYIQSLLVIF